MAQDEKIREVEIGFDGRPLKTASFATGQSHCVTFKAPILQLNHLYHDDVPVARAEYEVELEDGSIVRGRLSHSGQAELRGLRSRPIRVRYGLDPQPYKIIDDGSNPAYIAHFTQSDVSSLADPHAKRRPQPPDALAVGIEAVDWIWGTVKGGFNQKQTVSQIIVDAFIGMIPLVGDVTAVRDLIAIVIGMAHDPKKREDKLEWVALVVLLFALIPVIGGAIKGVGKLLLKGGKEAAEASKHLKEMVAFLNRLGMGDALQWLKDLKIEGYTGEVLGRWRELTHRLDRVLNSIPTKFKGVIPPSMLDHLGKLRLNLQAVAQKGEDMIPDAIQELSERLKAAQRQLYQGEWHAIPKNLNSSTREVEARLINVPGGKKWAVENMHFKPNSRDSFIKREGWPDLAEGNYVDVDPNTDIVKYKVIPCFSGSMRAVKIPPGTKIYRVIEKNGYPAGDWWVYDLPESGKEWREGLAVLDSWNENGYFVEMMIPDQGLVAWEGKAASQIENSPKAGASMGQYLPGGQVQLFIDFKFKPNTLALEDLARRKNPAFKELTKETVQDVLPLNETAWKDTYQGLHVPTKNAEADFLGPFEIESKNRLKATLIEKSGRRKRQEEE
jgi:hypothetical protein